MGFSGHSTINHDYNLKTVGGDKVVVDNATGLMWHQGGSDDELWADGQVNEWIVGNYNMLFKSNTYNVLYRLCPEILKKRTLEYVCRSLPINFVN